MAFRTGTKLAATHSFLVVQIGGGFCILVCPVVAADLLQIAFLMETVESRGQKGEMQMTWAVPIAAVDLGNGIWRVVCSQRHVTFC